MYGTWVVNIPITILSNFEMINRDEHLRWNMELTSSSNEPHETLQPIYLLPSQSNSHHEFVGINQVIASNKKTISQFEIWSPPTWFHPTKKQLFMKMFSQKTDCSWNDYWKQTWSSLQMRSLFKSCIVEEASCYHSSMYYRLCQASIHNISSSSGVQHTTTTVNKLIVKPKHLKTNPL